MSSGSGAADAQGVGSPARCQSEDVSSSHDTKMPGHRSNIKRRVHPTVKNRRLAAMRRLQEQGDFFSDSAMRERAPLLHHQLLGHLGEVRPGCSESCGAALSSRAGPSAPRSLREAQEGAALRFSAALMQQVDEVAVQLRQRQEEEEEAAQLSEQESSEDDGAEAAADGAPSPSLHPRADRAAQQAAGEDSDWLRKQFLQEMENRFLSGAEMGVAYEDIDNDVDGVLDEHWRKEVQQDAEDRYFEDLESEEAAAEAPAHSNAPCDY
ncbi:coiled-coil domain-containing protein-domain-containing protein [Haematococcus lacustris]